MISILACCANGSGTSLMMDMTLERVIKQEGWNISKRHHCSISEVKNISVNYDLVLCPQNFINMFKDAEAKGVKVVGLRNVMSAKEIKEKVEAAGLDLK